MNNWYKSGGAAFPIADCGDIQPHEYGMTLRDWFAGQALAGHLASMKPGSFDASAAKHSAEELKLEPAEPEEM